MPSSGTQLISFLKLSHAEFILGYVYTAENTAGKLDGTAVSQFNFGHFHDCQ